MDKQSYMREVRSVFSEAISMTGQLPAELQGARENQLRQLEKKTVTLLSRALLWPSNQDIIHELPSANEWQRELDGAEEIVRGEAP